MNHAIYFYSKIFLKEKEKRLMISSEEKEKMFING